jgi:hypothetical protein
VLLVDSTPVECSRSRETVKRGGSSSLMDALSDAPDYGYCASHSRYFYASYTRSGRTDNGSPAARRSQRGVLAGEAHPCFGAGAVLTRS